MKSATAYGKNQKHMSDLSFNGIQSIPSQLSSTESHRNHMLISALNLFTSLGNYCFTKGPDVCGLMRFELFGQSAAAEAEPPVFQENLKHLNLRRRTCVFYITSS